MIPGGNDVSAVKILYRPSDEQNNYPGTGTAKIEKKPEGPEIPVIFLEMRALFSVWHFFSKHNIHQIVQYITVSSQYSTGIIQPI